MSESPLVIDTLTGEVMPAGEREAWSDDEWETYIKAADPGEAIRQRALRIYQFASECPRARGGSHFATFMRERLGCKKSTASAWKRIGEELSIIDGKFEGLQIAADWNAYVELASAPPAIVKQLRQEGGEMNRARVRAAKRVAKRPQPKRPPRSKTAYAEVWQDDVRDVSALKPQSVDAIITDPPYPQEHLELFSHLAVNARTWLKPTGVLAVMSGQAHLPEVMRRLCEHMDYLWACAYLTPGGQATQIFPRKVNTFWKPILCFAIDGKKWPGWGSPDQWLGDVMTSRPNDNDKRFHHWGQSESGIAQVIDKLTEPGQIVADPFLGGGTTGAVCLDMGRTFFGFDIDADAVKTAHQRLSDEP